MQILPVVLATNKEAYANFFVHLVSIYLPKTTLRFAVCDQDITFANTVFTAFPVKIGVIKESTSSKRDNVDITISDVTNAFKVALLGGSDFRGSNIEIIRISYPESLTDNTQFQQVFIGEIDAPKLDDGNSLFTCTAMDVMGNYECGRITMLSCNAVFGDAETCGANKFTTTGTVLPDSTKTHILINDVYVDNIWKHGLITINGQTLSVISSRGLTLKTEVVTEYPFFAEPSGNYVIERGCNKSFEHCKEQTNAATGDVDNRMNFSGCPGIPWELKVIT